MSSSLVNNKYRITRRIGGGSFGEIYMGVGPSGEKVSITDNCIHNVIVSILDSLVNMESFLIMIYLSIHRWPSNSRDMAHVVLN